MANGTTGEKHIHHGGDNDNVSIKPEHGNALAYTLDRLKRERPDLFERVVAIPKVHLEEIFAGHIYVPNDMISFSNDELSIIMNYAKPLAPHERDAFLREAADALKKHSTLGPGLISRVCAQVQRQFVVSQRATSGSQ